MTRKKQRTTAKIRRIVLQSGAAVELPFTIADAALLLGVSKRSIHNLIGKGLIRRVKPKNASRSRGVVASDVLGLVNAGEVGR